MGAAAAPLSIAATGLSALAPIMAGSQAASNARAGGMSNFLSSFYSSEQASLAADIGKLRATQTDTYMREQTHGALANIDAVAALSGATDDSPSTWAVRNRYEFLADRSRNQQVSNLKMDAQAKSNAATLYALSGMGAMQAADENARNLQFNGLLGGAASLFKSAGSSDPYGRYPGWAGRINW